MYVRDHARPAFHEALGLEPTEYGMRVFRITSEISKQVFPLEIDIDHPKFIQRLEDLRRIGERMAAAEQGGIMGRVKKAWYTGAAMTVFLRLYLIPAKNNALPQSARLQPAW